MLQNAGKCNKAKWQGVFGVTCYLSGRKKAKKMVGMGGFEPPTFCSQSRRRKLKNAVFIKFV